MYIYIYIYVGRAIQMVMNINYGSCIVMSFHLVDCDCGDGAMRIGRSWNVCVGSATNHAKRCSEVRASDINTIKIMDDTLHIIISMNNSMNRWMGV